MHWFTSRLSVHCDRCRDRLGRIEDGNIIRVSLCIVDENVCLGLNASAVAAYFAALTSSAVLIRVSRACIVFAYLAVGAIRNGTVRRRISSAMPPSFKDTHAWVGNDD